MTNVRLKEMSERIKERRKSLFFTQEQFAELAELSIGSYSKIENAFQQPSLDTLIRIAGKLEVSLDYLVFGDDAPKTLSDSEIFRIILELADPAMLIHTREVLDRIIDVKSK